MRAYEHQGRRIVEGDQKAIILNRGLDLGFFAGVVGNRQIVIVATALPTALAREFEADGKWHYILAGRG